MKIRYLDPSDITRQRLLHVPLRDLVIPSLYTEQLQALVPLSLLPISSNEREKWYFLELFGVKREPEFTHWLTCLKKIKPGPVESSPPTQGVSNSTPISISMITTIYFNLNMAYKSANDRPSILNEIR